MQTLHYLPDKIYMNKCHKKGSYVEYLNKYNFMAHGFASLKLK